MSENEKQDLAENDSKFDDEQIQNLEVGTAIGLSTIENHNVQQPTTEGTEVHPSNVVIVEQLSHESL